MKTLARYGAAQTLPSMSNHGPSNAALSLELAWLERWLVGKVRGFPNLVQTLDRLRHDVDCLWRLARDEFARDEQLALAAPFLVQSLPDSIPRFLNVLAGLHPRAALTPLETEREIEEAAPWLTATAFLLERDVARLLRQAPHPEMDREIARRQSLIRCYHILHDLSGWLSSGAFRWAADLEAGQDPRPPGAVAALLIDEFIADQDDAPGEALAADLSFRLQQIENAFVLPTRPPRSAVEFDCIPLENVWAHILDHMHGEKPLSTRAVTANTSHRTTSRGRTTLFDYDFLLVEVEHRRRRPGPIIIQKLAQYLEGQVRSGRHRDRLPPSIIVLSRSDNQIDVHQCLNLGAQAYVRKENLYELPAQIVSARIAHRRPEAHGHRSNFSALYSLPPPAIVTLQSTRTAEMVLGHSKQVIPFGDANGPTSGRIPSVLADPQDRDWLRSLPKADLHAHFGTFIDMPTIEALALNSCGYVFERVALEASEAPLEGGIEVVIERICCLIELAGMFYGILVKTQGAEAADAKAVDAFSWARDWMDPEAGECARSKPSSDVFAEIVLWLWRPDRQLDPFEITSLVVACITIRGGTGDSGHDANALPRRAEKVWSYLQKLDELPETFKPRDWRHDVLRKTRKHFSRIALNWRRTTTSTPRPPLTAIDDLMKGDHFWTPVLERASARVRSASAKLSARLPLAIEQEERRLPLEARQFRVERRNELFKKTNSQDLLAQLEASRQASSGGAQAIVPRWPALREIVRIRDSVAANERTLLRYLRGASLLGADHLQYPENIILGAASVVAQMESENVWYTELRCETIGYSVGGMSAPDATDMLCNALTLASIHTAQRSTERLGSANACWTHVNVLMGAKRHKTKEKFQASVALLTHYLQRGRPSYVDYSPAPEWWRPTRVVGFDLSGDENKSCGEPSELIRPLLQHSAQITIHAGEAATAESIWHAVYEYGARRIGHGVRLREDQRLLEYCVGARICLELCPISNRYTNGFIPAPNIKRYRPEWREHYPLRYFLQQGLDVCICTDNRQLHGGRTLTDEYMCAAELVGGLTRWEVLRLVKTGFKRAFLPKAQVEALLSAVEDRVYEIVTQKRE